jgi:hypothetical protein
MNLSKVSLVFTALLAASASGLEFGRKENDVKTMRHHRRVLAGGAIIQSKYNRALDTNMTPRQNAQRFLTECASGAVTTFYYFNFEDGTLANGSTSRSEVEVTVDGKSFVVDVTCDDTFARGYGDVHGPVKGNNPAISNWEVVRCQNGGVYTACDETEIDVFSVKAAKKVNMVKKANNKGKQYSSMSYSLSYNYLGELVSDKEDLDWTKLSGTELASDNTEYLEWIKVIGKTYNQGTKDDVDLSFSFSYNYGRYDVMSYTHNADGDTLGLEAILALLPFSSILHALAEERMVEAESTPLLHQELRTSDEGIAVNQSAPSANKNGSQTIAPSANKNGSQAIAPSANKNGSHTIALTAGAMGIVAVATFLTVTAKKLMARSHHDDVTMFHDGTSANQENDMQEMN